MINSIKTSFLLGALIAMFMAAGYLIGGESGMLIAFALATTINLFSYGNIRQPMVARLSSSKN